MATTINPVVHYRDLEAGVRFLVETFGFVQHEAHKADDGSIQYVELSLNGAPLGLGPHAEGSMFDTGPAVVYISLDEVDSMHERAVAAGAEILMAPTDQDYGSRTSWPRTSRATCGASAPTSPGADASRRQPAPLRSPEWAAVTAGAHAAPSSAGRARSAPHRSQWVTVSTG